MIMLRHDIPLVPAELMAHYMHVVVPKKIQKQFWNIRTSTRIQAYGTQLNEHLTADPMFKKLNIPLRMSWRLIDEFATYKEFKNHISSYRRANNDVVVCFNAKALVYGMVDNGHVCVLDRVYPRKESIRIIDPGQKQPKWRMVTMKKLYKAMQVHGKDNKAGFWEFKKSKVC